MNFLHLTIFRQNYREQIFFTKFDAKSGYRMLPLDGESSRLCTMQTPFGRNKFKRLPFGLSCAGEIFYRIISEIFEYIPGVITYQDDILIWSESRDIRY